MDQEEARTVLAAEMERYRGRTRGELEALLRDTDLKEVRGISGTTYQVEIQAFWDTRLGGDLRIVGSVDDRGWSAFHPMVWSYLVSPDGGRIGAETPGTASISPLPREALDFILLTFAASGAGLAFGFLADRASLRSGGAYLDERDGAFALLFMLAVAAVGTHVFRNASLATRILLSLATALCACLLALLFFVVVVGGPLVARSYGL